VTFSLTVERRCCLPFLHLFKLMFESLLHSLFHFSYICEPFAPLSNSLRLLREPGKTPLPKSLPETRYFLLFNPLLYSCICMMTCLEYLLRSHYLSYIFFGFILSCLCSSLFLLVIWFRLNLKFILACGFLCLNVCLNLLVFVFIDTFYDGLPNSVPLGTQNLLEEVSIYISHEQIVAYMKSNAKKKCHFFRENNRALRVIPYREYEHVFVVTSPRTLRIPFVI